MADENVSLAYWEVLCVLEMEGEGDRALWSGFLRLSKKTKRMKSSQQFYSVDWLLK